MAVVKYNAEAMEQCRSTVSSQAGQFGGIGDGFSGQGGSGDIFGKLPSSAGLSGAVDSFNSTMGAEFAAAESVLGKVERALDAVEQTVADTEQANTNSLTAV
ncbi:hypothetical protein [Goodfellowiella coeruleoviolacea]|uniref:Uncharacterized protein n=1 Tax=Goodfellowiella coeruleoviolacea TaxID=334858 RepID=A0AAE3KGG8_9PSEU|nr:hypothetical protein [Goodfellowiella coeruleoviolacea]MCP2166175.1 hypothetical protein [Goodfellowiella coeruleoviolacea]